MGGSGIVGEVAYLRKEVLRRVGKAMDGAGNFRITASQERPECCNGRGHTDPGVQLNSSIDLPDLVCDARIIYGEFDAPCFLERCDPSVARRFSRFVRSPRYGHAHAQYNGLTPVPFLMRFPCTVKSPEDLKGTIQFAHGILGAMTQARNFEMAL